MPCLAMCIPVASETDCNVQPIHSHTYPHYSVRKSHLRPERTQIRLWETILPIMHSPYLCLMLAELGLHFLGASGTLPRSHSSQHY
jgi:hypothetical protein